MPFTFSHPAIVLPLTYLPKRWFSLTGLVVGSVTPDFEYFLRMRIQSDYSHTIKGLLWFDLPLGLLLAFVFHNIVRDTLFDNLPIALKSRVVIFKQFAWNSHFKKNWPVVVISILIGAGSHLLWDSFTHEHGYFVKMIPSLETTVTLLVVQAPMYKILQHFSTLIGGLVIVFAIIKLPAERSVYQPLQMKYWVVFLSLIVVIIALRFLSGFDYSFFGHVIATAISAGLIALIVAPLLVKAKRLPL
jgi:hypothetical protein